MTAAVLVSEHAEAAEVTYDPSDVKADNKDKDKDMVLVLLNAVTNS